MLSCIKTIFIVDVYQNSQCIFIWLRSLFNECYWIAVEVAIGSDDEGLCKSEKREKRKCLDEGLIREPRVQMDFKFVMWPLVVQACLPALNWRRIERFTFNRMMLMSPITRHHLSVDNYDPHLIQEVIGSCKTLDCWEVEMHCTASRNLCSWVKKETTDRFWVES